MIKRGFDFKLLNIGVLSIILLVLCITSNIWISIIIKIINILIPFVIAWVFAYLFYPILKYMEKHNVPKCIGVTLIIIFSLGTIYLTIISLIPLIVDQLINLFDNLVIFINDMSNKYDIDLSFILSKTSNLEKIINNYSKVISDSAVSIINVLIKVITIFIVSFIVGIYFLVGMDDIRRNISKFLIKINKRTYNYIKKLDNEMRLYFVGMGQFILVQLIEYFIIFYLIGHPYYLILSLLASFTTIIPYFGGMIAGFIAVITGFSISMKLGVLTTIVVMILSNIDGYITSPFIFKKTNHIPTLLIIFSVFALGGLFGIIGVIIAMPMTIILVTTYRFYRKDIWKKLKRRRKK